MAATTDNRRGNRRGLLGIRPREDEVYAALDIVMDRLYERFGEKGQIALDEDDHQAA